MTVVLITAARLAYQGWLTPYELVADEAQYWDWSRHLSASYYEKGPGIAWLIALSTRMLGTSAFAVRAPAAISIGIVSLAVAWLAAEWAPDAATARRSAVAGALLVSLLPVYQLTAILMTIDAPYYACCAVAAVAAWYAWVGERDGRPSTAAWTATSLAIGFGFLFKYTAAILVPGFALFLIVERARVRWDTAWLRITCALLTLVITVSPVIVWNLTHGAAALAHLLGYVNVPGGDRPFVSRSYQPVWSFSLIAAQCGIVGPALYAMARAVMTWRHRRPDVVRFVTCGAAPSLGFVLATSRGPAEANWPAAAYLWLLPLAACCVASDPVAGTRRYRAVLAAYGIAGALAIHAPLAVARVPLVGRFVPVHRFTGTAAAATQLGWAIDLVRRQTGPHPIIVATSHNAAGLLAFYLPGRPTVASAGHYLGDRWSSYDFLAGTDLSRTDALGAPAVLIGGTPDEWRRAFFVDRVTTLSMNPPSYLAARFDGPRSPARQTRDLR
jgi:4-amino-4-deoxy-L-arabinose transferase-like glycosyltransferase